MHRLFFLSAVALSSITLSTANPVAPGDTVALSGSTFGSHPEWGGTSVDDGNVPFEIRNAGGTVILSGNLQDRVSRSRTLGTLQFIPRLRDTISPTGTARIVRMVVEGHAGFDLNIEYGTDGSGEIGPGQVERSAGDGNTLDFSFAANPIAPTDESYFIHIVTGTMGYAKVGRVTIYAEESPGGAIFSTTLENTNAPVAVDANRIELLSIDRADNGLITITYTAAADLQHEIQRSSDGENWTTFRNDFPETSPATESFFANGSPDEELYRVIRP